VVREALSDPELIDFPGLGTLEAFNTDGLRSLLKTIRAPNLKEKTLRWPGHIDKIRVLRAAGLFGTEPVDVGGVRVRPIDLTARLLFPQWRLGEKDEEFTVMRVDVDGTRGGAAFRCVYDLVDRTDPAAGDTSMARTTGFPAAIVGRLLLRGEFRRPGVHPPETLGADRGLFRHVIEELRRRGVSFTERIAETAPPPAP
jgi:saccharopine dehydrogenase-like NADP-dependent oxidoreductase